MRQLTRRQTTSLKIGVIRAELVACDAFGDTFWETSKLHRGRNVLSSRLGKFDKLKRVSRTAPTAPEEFPSHSYVEVLEC